MNCQEFYDEMKAALEYYGVNWHDKHLVDIKIVHDEIQFHYTPVPYVAQKKAPENGG